MVDEQVAHDLRGGGEEVQAVLPPGARLVDELQVALVHQVGRREGVPVALALEPVVGHLAQLVVDLRPETFARLVVAGAARLQQLRHVARRVSRGLVVVRPFVPRSLVPRSLVPRWRQGGPVVLRLHEKLFLLK